MDLAKTIRDIPDFPKEGIIFKDITTLLKNKAALKDSIDQLVAYFKDKEIDYVVGIESRGFIFGTVMAYQLGVGFVPVRKKGKLPGKTIHVEYELEYGTDVLEIHEDAIEAGKKVVIIDDLLATGGTVEAVAKLVEMLKVEIVGMGFVIELGFLNGREKLTGYDICSLVKY